MSLQARQTTQQRFLLAPNVTLALEVLHMPIMELQAFLRQQMEENLLLEIVEESSLQGEEDTSLPDPATKEDAQAGALDEEWLSHWKMADQPGVSEDDAGDESRPLEQRLAKPESLYDSLRTQLGCQPLSPEERRLGEALIDQLDENGYLEGSLDELATALGVGLPALEEVLTVIQRFEPAGVGARDLRECLMIQLAHHDACGTLAFRIVEHDFPLFAQHNLSALARATGSTLAQVEEACRSLTRLNPKPGRAFSGTLPPSVIPDLIIVRRDTHYDVELNDQELPHVTINRRYSRMLKDPTTAEDAKTFLASYLQKAQWLVKAIQERHATLLAIGRCLISLQWEFVEHGPQALKPLTQAQVAVLVGRHPSTVSRAIAGKTIETPHGIWRLERFFASGIPQVEASAGHVSDAQVKAEIQRLVAEEDARKPLSDEALARRLAERRITVARRTIAKYRTNLKILPTHLRKRHAS